MVRPLISSGARRSVDREIQRLLETGDEEQADRVRAEFAAYEVDPALDQVPGAVVAVRAAETHANAADESVDAESSAVWVGHPEGQGQPRPELDIVNRAAARFDAILSLIPSRALPTRVNSEVVGDALERIGTAAAKGRSRWYLRALFAMTLLVVLLEVVRYVARSIKGEKALRR